MDIATRRIRPDFPRSGPLPFCAARLPALVLFTAFAWLTAASGATAQGFAEDWTHRHVVFSNPGRAPAAMVSMDYVRWARVVNDPRFLMQQRRMQQQRQTQLQQIRPPQIQQPQIQRPQIQLPQIQRPQLLLPQSGPPGIQSGIGAFLPRPGMVQRDWAMSLFNAPVGSAANGANRYPAKYSFDTSVAFCDNAANPDFVVFATGLTGAADIIAYDNVYKVGCTGDTPLIYWQYSLGGTIPSSPVFSYDGRQMAFINVNGNVASLLLLKWAKNPVLVTPTAVTPANFRTCVAPCVTSITLNGSPNSTGSSVFYDYNSDSIYVGDNSGVLHKFINIFLSGTPSEITTVNAASGWPLTLDAGRALPSPVFDPVSNNVIIGIQSGRVIRIPAGGGTGNIIQSAQVATACGFLSPPLVDLWAGRAYFTLTDWSNAATGTCGTPAGGPGIIAFSTTFASGASHLAIQYTGQGTARAVGSSAGTFDNAYYNSANPASPSGAIYACLNAPRPRLVQFNVASNVLSSRVLGPFLSTTTAPTNAAPQPTCAPITAFFNGTTDQVFTGVNTGVVTTAGTYSCVGGASSIGSGCITAYNVTQPFTLGPATPAAAVLPVPGGGPSGIVIDNRATSPGAAQVYFSTIMPQLCAGNQSGTGAGTGYCAIQASQVGLN